MTARAAAPSLRADAGRRLLVGVPALLAVGMQASFCLHGGDMAVYRAAMILLGAALVASACAARALEIRSAAARLAAACAAAATFWLAALEVLLQRGPVLARGTLGLAAAALGHAAAVSFATAPDDGAPGQRGAHLLLAASATFLALFAVESGFEAVRPADLYDILPDDPTAGAWWTAFPNVRWAPRPGFRGRYVHPEFRGSRVEINALGFRDGLDETAPPRPGERSVLVLGDSLVFGTGVDVDETFHRLLELRAREIVADPLRVYGAGVPGFGQIDELHYLETLAPRVRPDAVIVGLYEGNDLEDNLDPAARAAGRANPPASPPAARDPRPLLVRFLHGVIRPPFWTGSSAAFQYVEPTIGPPLVRLGLLPPTVPANEILDLSLLVRPPPLIDHALDTTRDALRALAARCRELHAALVVLVIPAAIQAEPARFADFLATHPAEQRDRYSRTALHERIVQIVRELGVVTVDPLPRLTAEALAGRSCYRVEGHWNAAGHRLAADLLVPVLADVLRAQRDGGAVSTR